MKLRLKSALYCILLAAASVYAALPPDIEAELSDSINNSMCFLFKAFEAIVGPLMVLAIVWFALQYVGADEDVKRREKAKKDMIEVLIALMFMAIIPYLINTVAGGAIDCT